VFGDVFSCIIICHCKVHFKKENPCEKAVDCKTHKSHSYSKNSDVTQIFEKLSLMHIVAGVKNNGREEKIEKTFVAELKFLNMTFTQCEP